MKFFIIFLLFAYVFCESQVLPHLNKKTFANGINGFSLEFTKKLERIETKNELFSPLGLAMTTGMLIQGAKGQIKDDMLRMLGMSEYNNNDIIHEMFKNVSDEYKEMATRSQKPRNVTLELSNLFMSQAGISIPETFTNALRSNYEANVEQQNFAKNAASITQKINSFVAQRTHGLIPQLFKESLDPSTLVVLLNTIYFKGYWLHFFDSTSTKDEIFYNSNETTSKVPTMNSKNSVYNYYHAKQHKAKIIELPYKGDVSMYVFLPDEKYGLKNMLHSLKKGDLDGFIENMKQTQMDLYFPKFEYEYEINLLDQFPKFNVNLVTVLSSLNQALQVSSAFHKAKIRVHEAGTEAAAVTVTLSGILSAINQNFYRMEIRVDHPFLYIIRDKQSNVNLFVGIVNKL